MHQEIPNPDLPAVDFTAKVASKKDLYKVLRNFSEKMVRDEINKVICTYRGMPIHEAKMQKRLRPGEVAAVMKAFA